MSARQHEYRGGAGESGNLGYPRRPEPGAVLLSTCHRPDQRTRSNLTANSTEHLPDWPAQNVGKMLTAFCGCFWLTDQFFDLRGIEQTVLGASGFPLDRTLEWRITAPAAAP